MQIANPPTTSQADAALVLRIKYHHDQEAFSQLFHRYYGWLCQQAHAYCHCLQRSEEIVLDVFTKFWKRREELQIDTQVKAYLFIAVRNRAFDFLRQQQSRQRLERKLQLQSVPVLDSAEDQYIRQEFSAAVEAAVGKLPRQGQLVFRMSRERNLKYREIAEELGISIKTVETHMRRAFIQLRGDLQGWLK